MRLALGIHSPTLLVEVIKTIKENVFEFSVINGDWEGTFNHGKISILSKPNFKPLVNYRILEDKQDLLKGDYNNVLNNLNKE